MDRATETCMLLLELECGDAVVDALLKGSAHKVPKLALACVEAMRVSVKEFGVPVVVPPKPMLKGIAPLFDSKDAKVRGAAKDLTVELTRWLGHDAVRRDLIEKMRGTMQAEVQAAADAIEIGRAVRQRLTRKEAANPPAPDTAVDHIDAMDVDGGDGAVASAATTNGDVKLPDAYEFADPESILDVLETQPKDKETPKFWDAVNSSKWNQRLDAMTRLKELADAPRLASGDYGDVARALKKIVTKDANIACVGEACAAAGGLAKGLRKEWTREAKVLLPGMLDKLKDKNTSVVQKNQDALLLFSTHCFSLADVADDVLAALSHKMPKVPQQTMLWIAAACGEMKGAPAAAAQKALLPGVVKCTDAANPDVRAAALEAIAGMARACGGFKSVAKAIDTLDDAKKAKIEEMCGASSASASTKPAPLRTRDVNVSSKPNVSIAVKPAGVRSSGNGSLPRSGTAASKRPVASAKESSSEADADVADASPASKEELIERMTATYSADTVAKLQSSNWKERVQGMCAVAAAVDAMPAEEVGAAAGDTIRALAVFPGFDDKVFQVLAKAFEVFGVLAAKSPKFAKRDGAVAVQGLAEKIADAKLRAPASAALTALAEALGPKFVMAQLHKRTATHVNPKVTAESLLWCAGAIGEFTVAVVDVAFAISWCKSALAMSNPACKSAAGKVLGAMHAGLGPGLKDFLADLKDSQLKTLEAEFARNPYVGPVVEGARKVRADAAAEGTSVAAADGGLPRADVSGKITEKLIKEMGDPSWKVRAAAVEAVNEILAESAKRIAPNTGDLMPSLAKRFADANRNLAANALATVGAVAAAMGPAVGERRHGHGLVPEIVKQFSDSKAYVRAAAAGALEAWSAAAGLAKTLPPAADKLVELSVSGKMSGDGKSDALAWILTAVSGDDVAVTEDDLASVVAAAASGLADKNLGARAAGGKLVDEVIRRAGSAGAARLVTSSSLPPALKSAAAAYVEKGGAVAPSAPGSLNPSPSTSPVRVERSARPATARGAGAARSSLRASRVGAGVRASASSLPPPASSVASGPVLMADGAEKDARLRKMPKKPVKFEGLRDDEIGKISDDLKAASAPHVRADVHALLFGKDFRAHIQAVEHLEAALSESPDAVEGTLDLTLRWVVLRLCEQAPNTQSLLKVLDFTADALAVVKDRGARLSEQEAAFFLPALVDKCGHSMEAVRGKFRRIVRLVPGVYPASKVAGYLVRGLDSKNIKTRLEVLDVMGALMERHGLDVVERAGNRALAEVAKLADGARDVGARNAAFACLTTAYKVGGEDAWRHLGRISDSLRDALEDKFAKAAREMERKKEGAPGVWTRGGVLVGGAAAAAVPSVSRSIALEKGSSSPIAAMASAVFRPVQAMVSTVSSVLPGRRLRASPGPAAPEPETEEIPPVEVRIAGWTRSLDSVTSVSDAVAVEGMKSLCHEVMAAVGDAEAFRAMAPDCDALVGSLAARVSPIFDAAVAAPGPSTTRACKYVLNTMMQVFQEPTLAASVGQENERATVAALLERLLDANVPKMEEGPQLVKALNVLMLKLLEHCPRTNSFRALLGLLADAPEAVADEPAALVKFHDLVVKCLIKLTKSLGQNLDAVDLPTLLGDVHAFFHSLGVDEIRRRGQCDDKPLRMVKTILHEVCKLVGHDVWDSLHLCPPRDSTPTPIVYAYVELNLQSMPDAPGVPREAPTAAPSPKAPTPVKAPSPVKEPTPVKAPTPVKEPTPIKELTPVKAPSPVKEPTPVKALTPVKAPTPVKEPTPVKAPTPAKAATPRASTPEPEATPATMATPIGGGDVEMMDAPAPTPVSADLKSQLAGIFKKIGEKATTAKGLEELYDFSRVHPTVDIQPHLARTSGAFQNYIKRGLGKVEAARAAQAASAGFGGAVGGSASLIAPSPVPNMDRSAAEVYRERLARMAAAKGSAGPTPASSGSRPAPSAGLTTLRERMDRIAAKASGTGSSSGVAGATSRTPDHAEAFSDLQARMAKIKAGRE